MKLSISNIALPPYAHDQYFGQLKELGFEGLEVAPSRVWQDTWKGLSGRDVSAYRKAVEESGLEVVGLHSLLFDQRHLGLFMGEDIRTQTLDFFTHLSTVCRDIGGRTLIWGGGRFRRETSYADAMDETIDFFGTLADRIAGHGTCFCLEPLGPHDTDFIHSARESLAVVEAVNSSSMAVQLDAKALVENDEAGCDVFSAIQHKLVHFHANEPGLVALGETGTIDNELFGQCLRKIGYDGFVTAEQIMAKNDDGIGAIAQAAKVLKDCYLNG